MNSVNRTLIAEGFPEGANICAFESSMTHLLPDQHYYAYFSLSDRIKLSLRALRGYRLYSVMYEGEIVSYCFFKKNYMHKYHFMHKKDYLINPYYVTPKYRGNGYGGRLLAAAVADIKDNSSRIWAVVESDNIPSIKTLENLGFQHMGYAKKKYGWEYILTDFPTHLYVFCQKV